MVLEVRVAEAPVAGLHLVVVSEAVQRLAGDVHAAEDGQGYVSDGGAR